MNSAHLTEQQEAAEEASLIQFQQLLKPYVRSIHRTGRLVALGTIAAVFGSLWIYYQADRKMDATKLNNRFQDLKSSDTRREATIASIRRDLGRTSSDFERIQTSQKVQAEQMQAVLDDLRATQKLVVVCEEQLKQLHESMAQASDQIQQLETENKNLKEQFLLDDKARAHQAEVIESLQRLSENAKVVNKTPEKKRGFLGISRPR